MLWNHNGYYFKLIPSKLISMEEILSNPKQNYTNLNPLKSFGLIGCNCLGLYS